MNRREMLAGMGAAGAGAAVASVSIAAGELAAKKPVDAIMLPPDAPVGTYFTVVKIAPDKWISFPDPDACVKT